MLKHQTFKLSSNVPPESKYTFLILRLFKPRGVFIDINQKLWEILQKWNCFAIIASPIMNNAQISQIRQHDNTILLKCKISFKCCQNLTWNTKTLTAYHNKNPSSNKHQTPTELELPKAEGEREHISWLLGLRALRAERKSKFLLCTTFWFIKQKFCQSRENINHIYSCHERKIVIVIYVSCIKLSYLAASFQGTSTGKTWNETKQTNKKTSFFFMRIN